jgi:hypothetical protein|tara:strand:- start:518 stop:736 length:219 start_codon:yes stop_codon:yes gene_type:complete
MEVDHIKKVIKLNQLTMTEELELLKILVKKYNLVSVSEYARNQGISQPGALKRLGNGKVMYIEMIGRKFIIG